MTATRTATEVEGRRVSLSNLDKVLYPDVGFTKAQVISYYLDVAPVLLAHVADRPVTLRRFPDGVGGPSFFEKNAPKSKPDWVRTVRVPRQDRRRGAHIEAVVIGDVPTLLWAANLAALELHVPMWKVLEQDRYGPADLMVFDLDPGPPASVVECCTVACWVRDVLGQRGLGAFAKTSGLKGLQLYVPLEPSRPWEQTRYLARVIAREVEDAHGGQVVSNMRRDLRSGKVLIDWSQNHAAKTTVAPYSLRANSTPTVSTPVTWEEVETCARSGDAGRLVFAPTQTFERVARLGDLFASVSGVQAIDASRRRTEGTSTVQPQVTEPAVAEPAVDRQCRPTRSGTMPQEGWSEKRERQYDHIKEGLEARGEREAVAEEIAARTVNKERARAGEARQSSRTSTHDISSGRRGGLRSHRGPGGRTRDQLYEEARRRDVKGRSKMTKTQLERALER